MTGIILDSDVLLRLDLDIEEVRLRLAALFRPHGVTLAFRPVAPRIREAAALAGAAGADAAALERAGFAILGDFEVAAAASARARPGAVELVAALDGRGLPLVLLTDAGPACLPAALAAAGIPNIFKAIVAREEGRVGKPDPAGLLAAARALGDAQPIWYVGGHPTDFEAGRAAQ